MSTNTKLGLVDSWKLVSLSSHPINKLEKCLWNPRPDDSSDKVPNTMSRRAHTGRFVNKLQRILLLFLLSPLVHLFTRSEWTTQVSCFQQDYYRESELHYPTWGYANSACGHHNDNTFDEHHAHASNSAPPNPSRN